MRYKSFRIAIGTGRRERLKSLLRTGRRERLKSLLRTEETTKVVTTN
ncbi:MAG: hypothetical protein ACRC8Y_13940 [Chroococcales cyanobacterium]